MPCPPWLPSVSVMRSVRGIVFGDDAAGLQIVGDEALLTMLERDDLRRLGEGRRRSRLVAAASSRRRRCRAGSGQTSGAPGASASIAPTTCGSGSQSIAIASAASLRLLEGVGDDEGDGIADMADHVARQHRIGRRVDL